MGLLEGLKEFLQKRKPLARDASGAETDIELQAATAILLIEAAYGDTEYVWHEHRTIVKGLERAFGLGRSEVLDILGRANEIRPPVVKLADVTDVIRDRFDKEQRKEVVRLVWSVIKADGSVDEWEALFGDHIAKVLGFSSEEARRAQTR